MSTIHVHQTFHIHSLRVDSLANSSVLQIGTAGVVKALSNNYNTGGYTGPAPQAVSPTGTTDSPESVSQSPLVPFSN